MLTRVLEAGLDLDRGEGAGPDRPVLGEEGGPGGQVHLGHVEVVQELGLFVCRVLEPCAENVERCAEKIENWAENVERCAEKVENWTENVEPCAENVGALCRKCWDNRKKSWNVG